MKILVNGFSYHKIKKTDCMINSLIAALQVEGINISPAEALLLSKGIEFFFFDANTSGEFPVMGLTGVAVDFFDRFSKNSKIRLSHHSISDVNVDFETIANAIKSNHCVIAMTDRYEMAYAISNRLRNKISASKHMPRHCVLIHGVDTENRKFLICETMLASKKHDIWLDYSTFDKVRICQWLDLSIYRDIYIVEDVSHFSTVNKEKLLYSMIESLILHIKESIRLIHNFVNKYQGDSDVSKRYIIATTKVIEMCLNGFDLSGYFYRGYLYDIVSNYCESDSIIEKYCCLKKSWCNLNKSLLKNPNYDYCIELFKQILCIASQELEIHEILINNLSNRMQ